MESLWKFVVLFVVLQSTVVFGKELHSAHSLQKRSLPILLDLFKIETWFKSGDGNDVIGNETDTTTQSSEPSDSDHHQSKRSVGELKALDDLIHLPHRKLEEFLRTLPGGKLLVHDHQNHHDSAPLTVENILSLPSWVHHSSATKSPSGANPAVSPLVLFQRRPNGGPPVVILAKPIPVSEAVVTEKPVAEPRSNKNLTEISENSTTGIPTTEVTTEGTSETDTTTAVVETTTVVAESTTAAEVTRAAEPTPAAETTPTGETTPAAETTTVGETTTISESAPGASESTSVATTKEAPTTEAGSESTTTQ